MMFKLIEPNNQHSNESLITPFLMTLQNDPVLRFFSQHPDQATFIITSDEAKGIYGGALLSKKRLATLHPSLKKSMASFASEDGYVWMCTVSLSIKTDVLAYNFEAFCNVFYRELYNTLHQFGQKEEINFLGVVLEPGEYLCTEVIGLWPYVMEIRPQDSSDGLFHGILSLPKNQPYMCIKPSLPSYTNQLAA